ncbi:hypothetical protein [Paracoccus sp. ME4]|uniref:hypothetical protein n=1 Tax=Paracoccus sp. ME4 TaxID=3138066 RepID=UPI00398B09CA
MAQITGVVTAVHDGTEYSLILGMSGLARLQEEYGKDMAPIVAMFEEGEMPDFAVLLRVTELALQRHHPEGGRELADDLLTADITVPVRVINAAFEGLQAQGGKAGKGTAGGNGVRAGGKAKARKG